MKVGKILDRLGWRGRIPVVTKEVYEEYYEGRDLGEIDRDLEEIILRVGTIEPLDHSWFCEYTELEDVVNLFKKSVKRGWIELLSSKNLRDRLFTYLEKIEPRLSYLVLTYEIVAKGEDVPVEGLDLTLRKLKEVLEEERKVLRGFEGISLKEVEEFTLKALRTSDKNKKVIYLDRIIQNLHLDPDLFYHCLAEVNEKKDYRKIGEIWHTVNLLARFLDYLRYGSEEKVTLELLKSSFWEFLKE